MSNRSLAVSIVVYKTNPMTLRRCIESVLNENCNILIYLVDNSPINEIVNIYPQKNITYIFNDANLGYGAGHNIAINKTIQQKIKYHLVLNPDVYFEKEIIEELYDFMENNPDVGLVMPKILYPDGSVQHLCKLLPSPLDLLRRRFLPNKINKKSDSCYELHFTGYDKIMDVPYLSGCFMFIRTEALKRVGLFDERFFMYLEDVDLSRRIHKHYRTMYYPKVSVFHEFEKGSYKNSKLLRYHLLSAIKYFNKWGFFDGARKEINKKVIEKLKTL